MKFSGINPNTREEFTAEFDDFDHEFIDLLSMFEVTEEKVKKIIDNLDISADIKSLLYSFSKATIRVGERVIKIGRKIIDFICKVFTEFPTASFGMVFGAIAGFLISTIPVLGLLLGPVVTPILIALGLVGGILEDLKDKSLERKIREINAKFDPLRSQKMHHEK